MSMNRYRKVVESGSLTNSHLRKQDRRLTTQDQFTVVGFSHGPF